MIETISRTGYAFLRYLATRLLRIDLMLLALVVTLTTIGFIALFSAGYSFPWRIEGQIRNIAVAGVVMLVVSCIPVKAFQKATVPIFIVGCVLLLLTHFFGVTVKGATRWLNVGVRIQPSELMKLAVPMMLAWYYNVRGENVCNWDHLTAFIIMAVPVGLIVKQPDLGTSILVLIAGASVIFFAGLSKRILVSLTGILILSMPVIWSLMHDYQRQRVLTLLDPSADPLGKGFHILQALIAIGSGGFSGKGWMEGTQAHLDFIPERTSDFLFAVFSEEFGFVGNLVLLALYTALIGRSFYIAAFAETRFSRLLAGAIGCIFFTYTFVNMGMVSGILPVVGVPLPFMSYGGTALLILGRLHGHSALRFRRVQALTRRIRKELRAMNKICLAAATAAAAFLLSACSTGSKYYQHDGPPSSSAELDTSSATPRVEHFYPASLRPYTVMGQRYVPVTSDVKMDRRASPPGTASSSTATRRP